MALVDLSSLHTFRLPAKARCVAQLNALADFEQIDTTSPYWILGRGSNSIFVSDYQGTVYLVRNRGVQIEEQSEAYKITVAAGEDWHELVLRTVTEGMPGLENLALIPGTVGAAPVQNIGAYGVELSRFIGKVLAWDTQQHCWKTFDSDACCFGYRDSVFKQQVGRWVIAQVELYLTKAWHPTLSYADLKGLAADSDAATIMDEVIRVRRTKLPDPERQPNAGSFFKNPVVSTAQLHKLQQQYPDIVYYPVTTTQVKLAAGWMIDQLGLKGYECNGAQVNPRQALVLMNSGGATSASLKALATKVMASVESAFKVNLEPEVRLVGEQGLVEL